jgi:opacity protein-like surface antigen
MRHSLRLLVLIAACAAFPATAGAQTRTFMIRGFADVGSTSFTAKKSFNAVLGRDRGPLFGGGAEAVLPQGIFVSLRASRFRDTGERVFLFNGAPFKLGIPTTITITPLELTGGYRLDRGWRVVPYGGGGLSWYRYEETSRFATDAENVKDRFTGFQLVGGAEVRLLRWIAAAGEAQWATVPNALGEDANSVSHEFGESNLGGVTFRVKAVVGR